MLSTLSSHFFVLKLPVSTSSPPQIRSNSVTNNLAYTTHFPCSHVFDHRPLLGKIKHKKRGSWFCKILRASLLLQAFKITYSKERLLKSQTLWHKTTNKEATHHVTSHGTNTHLCTNINMIITLKTPFFL